MPVMCSLIPRLSPCRTMKSKEEESLAPFHMWCCSAMWEPAPSGEVKHYKCICFWWYCLPSFQPGWWHRLPPHAPTRETKKPTARTTWYQISFSIHS